MLEAFLQIVHEQESSNEGFQDLLRLEKEAHKKDESPGKDSTSREDCMDCLPCDLIPAMRQRRVPSTPSLSSLNVWCFLLDLLADGLDALPIDISAETSAEISISHAPDLDKELSTDDHGRRECARC